MYSNSYGGYGSYPFPNYTVDFNRQYGQTPYGEIQQRPQQFYQQPQQQQQMQQQQQSPQQSNGYFYYVNGIEGAKAFLCTPNSSVVLFDSDSNKFFIKSANQQGQASLKAFEYSEIADKTPPKSNVNVDVDKYVGRKEFDKLSAEFESLKAQFKKDNNKENKK